MDDSEFEFRHLIWEGDAWENDLQYEAESEAEIFLTWKKPYPKPADLSASDKRAFERSLKNADLMGDKDCRLVLATNKSFGFRPLKVFTFVKMEKSRWLLEASLVQADFTKKKKAIARLPLVTQTKRTKLLDAREARLEFMARFATEFLLPLPSLKVVFRAIGRPVASQPLATLKS